MQKYSIKRSIENLKSSDLNSSLFLEFGVFSGTSINLFSNKLKNSTIHAFDSFEGINKDWLGTSKEKGHFTMHGYLPEVNYNVNLIKGLVLDTLQNFLENIENKK